MVPLIGCDKSDAVGVWIGLRFGESGGVDSGVSADEV
jgi:hypothetical protein